jgi:hypothetical protein
MRSWSIRPNTGGPIIKAKRLVNQWLGVMAMSSQARAPLFFLLGLGIAIFALLGLGALDRGLSGFGDGSTGRSNTTGIFNAVFGLLVCSYFVLSAIGVLINNTRASLVKAAVVSHSPLLAAYGMVFFQSMGGSTALSGMALISVVALVFFSPWIALWRSVLRNAR